MAKKKQPKVQLHVPQKAKRRGGPHKIKPPERNLTCNLTVRICNMIRTGTPLNIACLAAGVCSLTLQRWLVRANAANNKPPEERDEIDLLYIEFQEQVNFAAGDAVARKIRRIDTAGKKGDWKADLAALRILDPERFNPQKKVEHKHSGAITHQHEVFEVNVEDLPLEIATKLYHQMKKSEEDQLLLPDNRDVNSTHNVGDK